LAHNTFHHTIRQGGTRSWLILIRRSRSPFLRAWHWDRLATEIHGQGRWDTISRDLLANFCQLLHPSQECLTAILADGVMVVGSRSER